ncbi:uncharacterized protein LOC143151576 [Ptiloglossa arizonensis]|uniref:uncharacterized protein LOC143151576 n=1 Tax=Ptiloglossa arizonensis TaxID=3350558 RepID=UPI003F9FF5A0
MRYVDAVLAFAVFLVFLDASLSPGNAFGETLTDAKLERANGSRDKVTTGWIIALPYRKRTSLCPDGERKDRRGNCRKTF